MENDLRNEANKIKQQENADGVVIIAFKNNQSYIVKTGKVFLIQNHIQKILQTINDDANTNKDIPEFVPEKPITVFCNSASHSNNNPPSF